jgi:predicted phosphoadenosine phosphosulfate sulfurtransferase
MPIDSAHVRLSDGVSQGLFVCFFAIFLTLIYDFWKIIYRDGSKYNHLYKFILEVALVSNRL